MAKRVTAPAVRALKARGEKVVCITAYDALFAAIAEEAGADVLLVGDSVGNVLLGYETTVPVTLDMMVHHTAAAARGCNRALLVADLPFGSYQSSTAQAVDSAVTLMQAGAQAVKLEGAYAEAVEAIVRAGIPVMGHLGMTPQSIHQFGGFRVQGRGDAAQRLKEEAMALQDAGAFSIVLELVPASVATDVSAALAIPTIGIGAGAGCDGQIQVIADVLGLSGIDLKHAKPYTDGRSLLRKALSDYVAEVRSGAFPTEEQSFEDRS